MTYALAFDIGSSSDPGFPPPLTSGAVRALAAVGSPVRRCFCAAKAWLRACPWALARHTQQQPPQSPRSKTALTAAVRDERQRPPRPRGTVWHTSSDGAGATAVAALSDDRFEALKLAAQVSA